MTSRGFYSAQYRRQHCTLHAFEQFGALYMHSHNDKYPFRLISIPTQVDTNEPSGLAVSITVFVFIMNQNPECPGYNKGKNQRDKLKYIFNVYSIHHHRYTPKCDALIVWGQHTKCSAYTISGGQHPCNTCQKIVRPCVFMKSRTHDVHVGLRKVVPTQFRFHVGPVSQPVAGSMTRNWLRR